MQRFMPLIALCHVCLRLFPGFPTLYAPLQHRLQRIPVTSDGTALHRSDPIV